LENPPMIIFTTAYNEYALEAFDVHAVGYLVKPVRQEKLQKAIEYARRPSHSQLSDIVKKDDKLDYRKYISASIRGNIELVPIEQIYYFHAEHKYVDVRHSKGEILIEESLKSLENEFSELFLRIHRNALVAKAYVSGFSKDPQGHWQVTFRDIDASLEVSRRHIAQVRKFVKNQ
jgi:two-component system response regulator AlgR